MPTVQALMPPLSLEDLGVIRWQPPEDAAGQLTTPLTPAQRRRRQILRAIEANPARPTARSPRSRAATTRPSPPPAGRGDFPAIGGEIPTLAGEED